MEINRKIKVSFKFKIGVIFVLAFCFIAIAANRLRTIHYLPFAVYMVNETGEIYNSKQVLFIGNVRSTVCSENDAVSYQGWIRKQFYDHIESLYQANLGVQHDLEGRHGYWRWEDGRNELIGIYERLAQRYPNKVFVNTFYFNCSNTVNTRIQTGRYWNNIGDSGYFEDLGGGKYKISLWQGRNRNPTNNNWYNTGTGTIGRDGLIHSVQPAVEGFPFSEYVFEGYWKIIDSGTIKLVKHRNYLKSSPPTSDEWGWQEGPVYEIVNR
ncbi:MAG: hypothetical protein RI573_16510 [Balneolaceae bacterium]|nr:hypothetical protein [Balneolaceae bacterium]